MGIYSDWILPRIVNTALDTEVVTQERKKTLGDVSGTILELGFGTGHNLPYYPSGVDRVVAVDPSVASAQLARAHRGRAFPRRVPSAER